MLEPAAATTSAVPVFRFVEVAFVIPAPPVTAARAAVRVLNPGGPPAGSVAASAGFGPCSAQRVTGPLDTTDVPSPMAARDPTVASTVASASTLKEIAAFDVAVETATAWTSASLATIATEPASTETSLPSSATARLSRMVAVASVSLLASRAALITCSAPARMSARFSARSSKRPPEAIVDPSPMRACVRCPPPMPLRVASAFAPPLASGPPWPPSVSMSAWLSDTPRMVTSPPASSTTPSPVRARLSFSISPVASVDPRLTTPPPN